MAKQPDMTYYPIQLTLQRTAPDTTYSAATVLNITYSAGTAIASFKRNE